MRVYIVRLTWIFLLCHEEYESLLITEFNVEPRRYFLLNESKIRKKHL